MTSDSIVVPLRQPDMIDDPLTVVLRSGARRLLAQAVEAEAEAFLAMMTDARLPDGRGAHGPARPGPGAGDPDRDRSGRGATSETA